MDACRNHRGIPVATVFVLLLSACGPPESSPDAGGTWVGTITTEGNVTTVVNESGSVWGGTATLVEEASIGVDAGPDEYMFGFVDALYLTENHVYVVETQTPAVRAYDYEGVFIRTYGGEGQGPGEYTRPDTVAVDGAGRVFVLDIRLRRINVYAPSGEPVDTWPLETGSCCTARMFPLADGSIWKPVDWFDQNGDFRLGAQVVGPTGSRDVVWAPDVEYEQSTYESPSGNRVTTPYSPLHYASPAPDGKLVFGASDRYRFEVLASDGSRLIVQRYWDPIPVPPEHKEWERRRALGFDREVNDPEYQLDSSQIPDHKPAYRWFVPTQSGEIWLQRWGPSEPLAGCAGDPLEVGRVKARENPCWRDGAIIDAFDGDGRYLGDVDVPEELMPYVNPLTILGRIVAGVAQDDAGTYVVKRYRLVLPGER